MNRRRALQKAVAYCAALAGVTAILPRQIFAATDRRAPPGYPHVLAARMLEIHALRTLADDAERELDAIGKEVTNLVDYYTRSEPSYLRMIRYRNRIKHLERLPIDRG